MHLEADTNPRSEYPGRRRTALATRGWTLQEHVLSPRVLHYTSKQLVWNCQLQKTSESNANPEILWSGDRLWFKMDPKRFFLALHMPSHLTQESAGIAWSMSTQLVPSHSRPTDSLHWLL
ncbi:hypothetical protein OCU04_007734 [Sclerotinia nivalis]|uniref:Uncharacterized protein n=1 Tax=Sclerotinia nivalis TaxID=352851 RepID=A0A9X0AMT9_9HELO|nr:hypothetical protein OCU04_007734 [Sclerotinia nivalis]